MSTSGTDYETHTGAFTRTVGDGEILSNLLIEAGGANVAITVQDGGTVRNVGITNPTNSPAPLQPTCRNGGSALIDTVFISGSSDNGIFVNERHSGHLKIANYHAFDFVEDALYASPPGNPRYNSGKATESDPGGGWGTVEVVNSYAENCQDYAWRLGSAGSECRDSVANNCGTCFANLYGMAGRGGVRFVNCDAIGTNIGIKHIDHDPVNVGNWPENVLTILDGVRVTAPTPLAENATAAGSGTVRGTVEGSPSVAIPAGVPLSAEQAAAGESSATPTPPASGGSGDGDGDGLGGTPTPTSPTPGTGSGGYGQPTGCAFVTSGGYVGGGGGGGTGGTPGTGGDGGTGGGGGGGSQPLPSGVGEIGGGASYTDIYSAADADTVIPANDGPALGDAIVNASPGEVIYLEGGRYVIDRIALTTDGITIAGNRGAAAPVASTLNGGTVLTDGGGIDPDFGGEPGPIIAARGVEARPIKAKASNFLITGIRFEGPDTTWDGEGGSNDHHPVCIDHKGGQGMTVANCEFYGWEAKAIGAHGDGPDHIHHNHFHDMPGASMGYGVQSGPSSGQTLIERNYFKNCRHEVAADPDNAGYEVRYNIFAPSYWNHAVDQHGTGPPGGKAGGNLHIHHNTFLGTDAEKQESIRVRGTPTERCLIEKNSFRMTRMDVVIRQSAEPKYSNGDVFASAADPSGFRNMFLDGNYFGSGQPPAGIGAFADSGEAATVSAFARQVA